MPHIFKVSAKVSNYITDLTLVDLSSGKKSLVWRSSVPSSSYGGEAEIKARYLQKSGKPFGEEIEVGDGGDTYTAGLTAAEGKKGSLVVAWDSEPGWLSQKVNGNGEKVGLPNLISETITDMHIVASDGGYFGLYLQRGWIGSSFAGMYFDQKGLPSSEGFKPLSGIDVGFYPRAHAADIGGNSVAVTAINARDGNVYTQIVRDGTQTLSDMMKVNEYSFLSPNHDHHDARVFSTNDGGFIATFERTVYDEFRIGTFAQKFDKNGNKLGGEFKLPEGFENLTATSDGGFIAAYATSDGLFAQKYSAGGTKLGKRVKLSDEDDVASMGWASGDSVVLGESMNGDGLAYWIDSLDTVDGTPSSVVWGATFDMQDSPASMSKVLFKGSAGRDKMSGNQVNNTLDGKAGHDALFGKGGADRLNGAKGNDKLFGGGGTDILNGAKGGDKLNGGNSDDVLYGESGSDQLNGGRGSDVLWGGAGNDTFVFSKGDGADLIMDFEVGVDVIHFRSGASKVSQLSFEEDRGGYSQPDSVIVSYDSQSIHVYGVEYRDFVVEANFSFG